jgi:hypothetical protein
MNALNRKQNKRRMISRNYKIIINKNPYCQIKQIWELLTSPACNTQRVTTAISLVKAQNSHKLDPNH